MTLDDLVGMRVLNRHHQSCDYSQTYRDAHKGVVVGVDHGCNPTIRVLFEGRDDVAVMCITDLAFTDTYPQAGSSLREALGLYED